MVVNLANMDALFKTFSTKFSEAQKAAQGRAMPNDLIAEDIAVLMPVGGAATQHAWLEQIKGMREWIGERVLNNIRVNGMTVVNRSFENTVSVPRNAVEDDQYGLYAPLIGALGADAELLWLRLAVEALTGNAPWADGNPFFCAGRKLGAGKNAPVMTNAVVTALSMAAVETGLATMRSWVLGGDEPAEVVPEYLVVGPTLEGLAKSICEADIVSDGGEKPVGVSNVSTARALKVRVSGRLLGNRWYITARKGGIPCVAVQQRKKPVLTRLDKDTDTAVFMRNEFLYGTDARGEGFATLPFLAYMGGASAVATWSAAKLPPTT